MTEQEQILWMISLFILFCWYIHWQITPGGTLTDFTPVEKTDSLTVKDILLQPYYCYQMWKMIFEVIFEEKQKKSLTTTSKHVTLYM